MADQDRRHLLRRLRTDVQQLRAEVAQANEQTNVLLTAQETRTLTATEQAQERDLRRAAGHLHQRLRQLAREFRDLQGAD